MRYSTHPTHPPNLCRECGEQVRRPKRFCDTRCERLWRSGPEITDAQKDLYARSIEQIAKQRKERGITPEALEYRRKLSVQRPF